MPHNKQRDFSASPRNDPTGFGVRTQKWDLLEPETCSSTLNGIQPLKNSAAAVEQT
jgi:hypothetical protein